MWKSKLKKYKPNSKFSPSQIHYEDRNSGYLKEKMCGKNKHNFIYKNATT